MSNRQMEQNADDEQARYIAEQLGITEDELGETNWEIETHDGNEGVVYGHYIQFRDDSSKEVLDKIVGLENLCVDITFEEEPEDDYDPRDNGNELLQSDEINLGELIMPQIAEEARRKRDEGK
jgi:hypothetical protein